MPLIQSQLYLRLLWIFRILEHEYKLNLFQSSFGQRVSLQLSYLSLYIHSFLLLTSETQNMSDI